MIASYTENACKWFFLSETWTSYVESTGNSVLNWFLNLVIKQPWERMFHSMISWGRTNLMWPIPKKCSYLLARNATCSVSFEWHLWRIILTSFHQKKNTFFIWPGGGFPLFVYCISQKEICWFPFPWNDIQFNVLFAITYVNSVLFSCLFPLHNSWFGVLVNADNMLKMNLVFSMIFHTNTITYTDA